MSLSIYVHTPYCLQRCRYCDFTTFEAHEIYSPKIYFTDLLSEIRNRHSLWKERRIQSLYFGGGTPSLVDPEFIISVIEEFANLGFAFLDDREITIEINPATITPEKLDQYLKAGINRFSVGAQTFSDFHLKSAGRKHSAQDTRDTLELLKNRNLVFSFDLLFALPHQTLRELDQDLDEIEQWDPPHLSTYCLTVPEGHPMSFQRPAEEVQVEMFGRIEKRLNQMGLKKYEISNFSKAGFESVHNFAYWKDQAYWGVGLSSHSYNPALGPYGTRFWNTKSIKEYSRRAALKGHEWSDFLDKKQIENLRQHEAMTDLCHMFLRTSAGLPRAALQKFAASSQELIHNRLDDLVRDQLLEEKMGFWRLSSENEIRSNLIFEKLTFLAEDVPPLVDAGH